MSLLVCKQKLELYEDGGETYKFTMNLYPRVNYNGESADFKALFGIGFYRQAKFSYPINLGKFYKVNKIHCKFNKGAGLIRVSRVGRMVSKNYNVCYRPSKLYIEVEEI